MKRSASDIDKLVRDFIFDIDQKRSSSTHSENELQEAQAVLQKNITYKKLLKNRMLIVQSIRHGVPYVLFEEIQKQTPFTEEDWADFLNISTKSLQRYKAAEKHIFKPIHSEKIFELAEVTELGKEAFGSHEKFYRWLDTPVMGLGGDKPSDLIKNSYGKELVIDALCRIDQGIFA